MRYVQVDAVGLLSKELLVKFIYSFIILRKRGKGMRLKRIAYYTLIGTGILLASSASNKEIVNTKAEPKTAEFKPIEFKPLKFAPMTFNLQDKQALENKLKQFYLESKSTELQGRYLSNTLEGRKKLEPFLGTKGYASAVRKELPGAPVGYHCVYGQYTQLNRALKDMGDTLTLIPNEASQACFQFKHQMKQKYGSAEYADCIYEGRMFQSDSAFTQALNQFLARNRISETSNDSLRTEFINKFKKKNFSVEDLHAGAMLVVPRYKGSKNEFHMIVFIGKGFIKEGNFVPDDNGEYIYAGYNNEKMGELFKTWDTSNVFAADTKNIAKAQYAKEYDSLCTMQNHDLVRFINQNTPVCDRRLDFLPRQTLVDIAKLKYFQSYFAKDTQSAPYINQGIYLKHLLDKKFQNSI